MSRTSVLDLVVGLFRKNLVQLVRVALVNKEYMKRLGRNIEVLLTVKMRRVGRDVFCQSARRRRFHLNIGCWAMPTHVHFERDGTRFHTACGLTQGMLRRLAELAEKNPRLQGWYPTMAIEGGPAWKPDAWENAFNASIRGSEEGEPQIRPYGLGSYDFMKTWNTTIRMDRAERDTEVMMREQFPIDRKKKVGCVHFWGKYGISLERVIGMLEVLQEAGWLILALDGMKEKNGNFAAIPAGKYRGQPLQKKNIVQLRLEDAGPAPKGMQSRR